MPSSGIPAEEPVWGWVLLSFYYISIISNLHRTIRTQYTDKPVLVFSMALLQYDVLALTTLLHPLWWGYTVSDLPSIWEQRLVLGSHNDCSVKAIRAAQPHHGLSNHPCMCAHVCLLSKMSYMAWVYLRIYVDKNTIVQKLLEMSFAKYGYGSQEVSGLDTFGIPSFSWATILQCEAPTIPKSLNVFTCRMLFFQRWACRCL